MTALTRNRNSVDHVNLFQVLDQISECIDPVLSVVGDDAPTRKDSRYNCAEAYSCEERNLG
jgi:hypothetical protein